MLSRVLISSAYSEQASANALLFSSTGSGTERPASGGNGRGCEARGPVGEEVGPADRSERRQGGVM